MPIVFYTFTCYITTAHMILESWHCCTKTQGGNDGTLYQWGIATNWPSSKGDGDWNKIPPVGIASHTEVQPDISSLVLLGNYNQWVHLHSTGRTQNSDWLTSHQQEWTTKHWQLLSVGIGALSRKLSDEITAVKLSLRVFYSVLIPSLNMSQVMKYEHHTHHCYHYQRSKTDEIYATEITQITDDDKRRCDTDSVLSGMWMLPEMTANATLSPRW